MKKETQSSSQTEDDVEEKGGEEKAGEPAKTGGAQYSGGLVLEPKKGEWGGGGEGILWVIEYVKAIIDLAATLAG